MVVVTRAIISARREMVAQKRAKNDSQIEWSLVLTISVLHHRKVSTVQYMNRFITIGSIGRGYSLLIV